MTEKEYMDNLREMILLYKQIKEMSEEMKDAGFKFPIAMNVGAYDEERIHLHGDKLPTLKFKTDDNEYENWVIHSAEFAGVTLFYLTHKADINNEIGLTD
jgi:hypothetical protein